MEVTSLNTAKSIFDHQNDTFLLRCLSAQRCVYSRAKLAAQLKTVFTISFAVVSATASILDIDWLSASASLMAVALLIFNKYSDGYIASRKKQAASVQQYIDATLYAAAIHCDISDWGDIPEKSELAATVSKYENTDTSDMKNWYSNYSGLPVEEQVFRCQSENIRWDYCLHKSFRTLQIILLTVVVIVMLTMSIITNPTFVKIICIMSWFVPIAEYAYSTYKEVDNSIILLQEMDKLSAEIEKKLPTSSIRTLKRELIKLQHKIWHRREYGYLIPDWFYKCHKQSQQEREDKIAKTIRNLE